MGRSRLSTSHRCSTYLSVVSWRKQICCRDIRSCHWSSSPAYLRLRSRLSVGEPAALVETPGGVLAALAWKALSCEQELVVPGKSSADLLMERNASLGQEEPRVCQGIPEAGVWEKGMSYFIDVVSYFGSWASGKIWVSALYIIFLPSCIKKKKAEPSPNSVTAPKKFNAICREAAL